MADKAKNKNKKKNSGKETIVEERYGAEFFSSTLFIHGVVWSLLFVFTAVFMYISSNALVAGTVRGMLGGLFGVTAYAVPALFAGTLIYLVISKSVARMWRKFLLSLSEICIVSAIIGLFTDYGDALSAFDYCKEHINGSGAVGFAAAATLSGLITKVGAFIFLFLLFVVIGCFIAHYNIMPGCVSAVKSFFGFSADVGERVRKKGSDYAKKYREKKEYFKDYDNYLKEGYDKDVRESKERRKILDDEELPESLSERFEKRREIRHKKSKFETINIANEFAEEQPTDAVRSAEGYDDLFDEGDEERFDIYNMKFSMGNSQAEIEPIESDGDITPRHMAEAEPVIAPNSTETDGAERVMRKSEDMSPDAATQTVQTEEETFPEDLQINEMKRPERTVPSQSAKKLSEPERTSFHDELDSALAGERIEYKYPTLDLLDEVEEVSADLRQELYSKAQQLIKVLDDFGVKAKPVQVTQGPTVTRFEIQPSSGIKLSKIVNLADDIAMNLAVSNVLIAPVPGKAATVGVEIPNTSVTTVKIRELLGSSEFRTAKSKLTVCLGKDIGGNVIVGDIAKWPHALIAGATGSGKSVCINTIITSLLYNADPNEVKLIMVDPKQVELGVYNGIPHLLIPVVTDPKKAAGALNWAVSEMMQRYSFFKSTGTRKLESYNKLMLKTGGEPLPQIVIIIDELADLMMVAAKEVEDYICRLAQLARAAGIHLIIATQRPSVDVITGLIKANIPSRIAFFVSSQVDSRTILDKSGAEKLLGRGDMLYFPAGARSTARVQGAWVSDGEVERIVDYIKSTSPPTHYSEDLEEHITRISTGENGVTPDKEDDGDPLLEEAIQLAVELGKISTSMIQRRLSVGYSRAGRIVDQMEKRGVVSPPNGSKPRDVLISHADFAGAGFDDDEIE